MRWERGRARPTRNLDFVLKIKRGGFEEGDMTIWFMFVKITLSA